MTSLPLSSVKHHGPVLHGLSPDQADGVACAVCAVPFRIGDRSIPVGNSTNGAQVFACADTCGLLDGAQ